MLHRSLTLTLSALALSAAALGSAQAQDVRRDYAPPIKWIPDVTGDRELSNTYDYWKDRKALDPKLYNAKTDQWKTNWKFMDPTVDQTLHEGYLALDRGETLYKKLNTNNGLANCLGAENGNLKGLKAQRYPRYNESLKKVVGLDEMIDRCTTQLGSRLEHGSYDNASVSLYIASFSNGMPIKIDVSSGPLKDAFERGKERYHVRVGSNNFACASCHTATVGMSLRGQVLTTPYGDMAHWPAFRTKGELQALHVRFSECNRNAGTQPLRPGAAAYTDIEVFLTALSNNYTVDVPAARD
ncbi:MAG: hypothetical protein Fur007_07990 [Rhodoferax sp.]